MFRFFILLVFLCNFSFALDLSPKKVPIFKNIEIAKNILTIEEALAYPSLFKEHKRFRRTIHREGVLNNTWIKIKITNDSNKEIEKVFLTRWVRAFFDIYLIKDNKIILKDKITTRDTLKKSNSINILPNENLDFYLHVKTEKAVDVFEYMYFIDANYVDKFIILNEKLYHFGLFFGILLTMAMYSFFMFFSIKEKGYLYLGLYQTWVLIATSDIWQYFLYLLQDVPEIAKLGKGLLLYSMMVFSILFAKEFLNTKKTMPKLNLFFNVVIVVLFFLIFLSNNVNYASFVYLTYVLAGIYIFIKTKDLAILFYILGFLGYALFFVFLNMSRLFDWDFSFEVIQLKQVFTCVESFSLTMALYIKLKSIMKEKEKASADAMKNERLMLEQSRFAAMGEMLASIAHQWRQPLNHLSMIFTNLQLANETSKLNTKYLNKKTAEANLQLQYMSDTIEDFSNFFSKKGVVEEFVLEEVCKLSLDLVSSRCKKLKVRTLIISNNQDIHRNYKHELTQVLVTILNNALDAFMLNNIENRQIKLIVSNNNIIIKDNAGGIPKKIIRKIFDPYFTTKESKFGTGLGLYTARMIVQNVLKSKIIVKNVDDGASFTIIIPQKKEI